MQPIIVALDFPDPAQALACAKTLDPRLCSVKVGITLFNRGGPQIIADLKALGFDIFLDLKFHDIPHQVYGAVTAAAELGVAMINVHASGGLAMLQAAREAIPVSSDAPLLIAVTVLTSLADADVAQIGYHGSSAEVALSLAKLTKTAQLDGVVCSAQEAKEFKQQLGVDFKLITPGIRLANAAADDQRRILTPEAAMAAGSDYLVIGRPITQAEQPVAVLETIAASIA